ncbi:hypothetical protein PIROE2DRAFT_5797 [Piromyces sp. E2]|nr:hypothetical protein PIROE2DRAFT_5797 [Piromyces sp. E2]|eukprot:OUM66937.1 hypothetical protein PIROE2DRAFT_5797 [Piromyces sp. E2]
MLGYCKMNYLQIFGNPNTYILTPTIENYGDKIRFDFPSIEITIKNCNPNQIKMKDKNNIQYCVEPICKKSCPIDISAKCIANSTELVNDINKNKCECFPGWYGENCTEKIFINFKNVGIIKDSGYYKILLFSFGMLLFIISIMFTTYSSYIECFMNFLLKHFGITLMLLIVNMYISLGCELGITDTLINNTSNTEIEINYNSNTNNTYQNDDFENDELSFSDNEANYQIILLLHKLMNCSSPSEIINENNNSNRNNISINTISSINIEEINQCAQNQEIINMIIKNIKNIHSILIEYAILYLLFIISNIILIIYNNKNAEKITVLQSENGEWYYKCNLETQNFIYDTFEVIFTYKRFLFEVIWNSLGNLIILIMFTWDKIYLICTKRGNDSYMYFKFINYKKCPIHNSFICGCPIEKSNRHSKALADKYILFYRHCSNLFSISNGRIRYINLNKKLKILNN